MKHLFITLLLVFTSCTKENCEEDYMEIYTPSTIYYVNLKDLHITSINDDTDLYFKNLEELSLFLKRRTEEDVNIIYQELDNCKYK